VATKKTCRPIGPYVKAHQRAYAWADKALGYRKAGKRALAKAAAQKARYWLCKVKLLGAQTASGAKRAKP
jgi:AAA+ superfamily predicted ATPase